MGGVKKQHLIQLGYVLSILLFMSGAIYFFASNWQELTKSFKISLSVFLMLSFYAVSYFGQHILPRWFMVSGTIAFGVALALLDQVYNSHPESYTLFLIWMIPALLYALVTRMEVYKVLSFVLLQFSMYFLVTQLLIIDVEFYLFLAIINIILFFLIEKAWLQSVILKYLSFASFHYWMLVTTFIIMTEDVSSIVYFAKWVYLATIIVFLYIYAKKSPHKVLLVLTSIGLVIYAILTFINYLVENNFEEYMFIVGLLLVITLIALSVFAIRKLKLQDHPFLHKVIIGSVTALATIIGTISVVGFFIITLKIDEPEVFYIFGFCLILLTFLIKNPTINYTLILIGCLLSGFSAWDISIFYYVFIWVFIIAVMVRNKSNGIRSLLFFFMNITLFLRFSFSDLFWMIDEDRIKWVIILLAALNTALYFVGRLPRIFTYNAFIYALLFLLFYTQQTFAYFYFYIVVQLLFFVLNTFLLFWTRAKGRQLEFWSFFIVYLMFLSLTYYDIAWKLLHKSIALMLLGAIVLLITFIWNRKYVSILDVNNGIWKSKRGWLIGILLLQMAILSWQIGYKEMLLQTGTEIKLELAPVDPRSMMQGDYVALNYEISRSFDFLGTYIWMKGDLVQLVLREQEGVYRYAGYYKYRRNWNFPYDAIDGDVIITGRVKGFSIQFGIEQYYVPEGTGRAVEETAKYAIVKVGKGGDAILVGLTDN